MHVVLYTVCYNERIIKTTWCFGLSWYQAPHKVRMSGSQVSHELPKILL